MKPPGAPLSRFVIEPARPEDDAAVRGLLRRSAMGTDVRLTLERDPDARLAAGIEGDRHLTIVARQRSSGRVVGVGTRAVREVWVNGRPRRIGYLGLLRRDPEVLGRKQLLVAGFAACERMRRPDELPYDLTSILADNTTARRLLERGLAGLPRYRPLCRFVTLLVPVRRGARTAMNSRRVAAISRGDDDQLSRIVTCLQANLRRYQFAPVWTVSDLNSPVRTRGLEPSDFFLAEERGRLIGCLARWDQRGFKQAVVRAYGPRLTRWRPLLNAALMAARRPQLPAVGRPLRLACLSHVAVAEDRAEVLIDLIEGARRDSLARELDFLVLGLAADNPLLSAVGNAFHARTLESVLYLVHGSECADQVEALDDRLPQVEVATL